MYRVAICEDDLTAGDELSKRCGAVLTGFDIPNDVAVFRTAEALDIALRERENVFDLLLLDIVLPGRSGIELGASLRELDDHVGIIFVTGYAEYALEGYRAQPCNYLLKPVSDAALTGALRKELRRHNKGRDIVFQEHGRAVRLPASEVIYLESFEHGILVHTSKEAIQFRISLAQANELLPAGVFTRCHNSFIVNLSQIKSASSTMIAFHSGEKVPVGRTYRDEFHRLFIEHFL